MASQVRRVSPAVFLVATGALLGACAQTPMGPTVQVMPGPGKSFDAFQGDQSTCKAFAANQVKGQAEAANNQAIGTAAVGTLLGAGLGAAAGSLGGAAGGGAAVGAAAGAGLGTGIAANNTSYAQMSIQQQYDSAFSQCMYAKGDQVPGYAPIASAAPVMCGPDPAMVRGVQRELIRLNYLRDVADGAVGPKTVTAIRQYERATGLPVDGAPSDGLLARLQGTPTSQAASAGGPAPGSATASAPAQPSNWVAPTQPGAVTPASATAVAPAAPSGWVAPAATQPQ